mmetsp:Transcript_130859/g.326473  ORF Transcript_130859/g.326473 Transcript_130859/m.326473 type:complete len:617 (-) Transcript_130859:1740-3590(-)
MASECLDPGGPLTWLESWPCTVPPAASWLCLSNSSPRRRTSADLSKSGALSVACPFMGTEAGGEEEPCAANAAERRSNSSPCRSKSDVALEATPPAVIAPEVVALSGKPATALLLDVTVEAKESMPLPPGTLMEALLVASGTCGSDSCWKPFPLLKAGGGADLVVVNKGSGTNFPLPLPLQGGTSVGCTCTCMGALPLGGTTWRLLPTAPAVRLKVSTVASFSKSAASAIEPADLNSLPDGPSAPTRLSPVRTPCANSSDKGSNSSTLGGLPTSLKSRVTPSSDTLSLCTSLSGNGALRVARISMGCCCCCCCDNCCMGIWAPTGGGPIDLLKGMLPAIGPGLPTSGDEAGEPIAPAGALLKPTTPGAMPDTAEAWEPGTRRDALAPGSVNNSGCPPTGGVATIADALPKTGPVPADAAATAAAAAAAAAGGGAEVGGGGIKPPPLRGCTSGGAPPGEIIAGLTKGAIMFGKPRGEVMPGNPATPGLGTGGPGRIIPRSDGLVDRWHLWQRLWYSGLLLWPQLEHSHTFGRGLERTPGVTETGAVNPTRATDAAEALLACAESAGIAPSVARPKTEGMVGGADVVRAADSAGSLSATSLILKRTPPLIVPSTAFFN